MSWFYAIHNQKHGPVSAAELADLSREGTVSGDDLAWREGMEIWQPFHRVAGEVFTEAAAPGDEVAGPVADGEAGEVETAVCAFSGLALPKSELVPYGDQWIDPRHKESFLQQLMETGESGIAAEDEFELIAVGFWWRVLGAFIDYLVLVIPSMLCMVPYYITAAGSGVAANQPTPENPLGVWSVMMIVAYLIGMFGSLAINATYHTWMLGKYQATVGKMTIGARVVNPDGSRLRYGRSFCRWLCKSLLNTLIMIICVMIGTAIGAAIMAATVAAAEESAGVIAGGVLAMFGLMSLGMAVGLFPFWMAAFDPEKRALHDRICSTRVVKKL